MSKKKDDFLSVDDLVSDKSKKEFKKHVETNKKVFKRILKKLEKY